jgi:hypothetical protein
MTRFSVALVAVQHAQMGRRHMKTLSACLSRVMLVCLLLTAPAMAGSIRYSVAFLGSSATVWNLNHHFPVEQPSILARISSGSGFDLSVSGAWPGDPLLAVSSDISTLLSGFVSDQIAGFRLATPPHPIPPNAVTLEPLPEPGSLLVIFGSGILGLAGMLAAKLRTTRAADR